MVNLDATSKDGLRCLKVASVPITWNPGLSIYASEPYLKTVGDENGWLGGTDGSGNLRCVLPYTVVRKLGIRMIRFRVETIPLVQDFGIEEEKSFLHSAVAYFRSSGADVIVPASNNTIFRTYPEGAMAAPYGTYLIDLAQPEETLWANLHPKHRNVVRHAMKHGVQIRRGVEHLDAAFATIKGTLKRSSLGFMKYQAFKRLLLNLGENVQLFTAEHQGAIQGCAVIPFSTYGAYYVYGGSIPEPQTGAMNLLHWEAMRFFRRLGVKRYDFVGVRVNPEKGSKQEGLKMFKERFGGNLVRGYMWKKSLSPLKYRVYSIAVRLLRGGDIVDVERDKLDGSHLGFR